MLLDIWSGVHVCIPGPCAGAVCLRAQREGRRCFRESRRSLKVGEGAEIRGRKELDEREIFKMKNSVMWKRGLGRESSEALRQIT